MVELYLIIPAVIIFLLFLPIILELKVTYNVLNNMGVISLYVFKFNILYYFYEIKDNEISIKDKENNKGKTIDVNSPEFVFIMKFIKEVFDKLRLRKLDIYYNIGVNDAFLTSMTCGFVNLLCLSLFTRIKQEKPTATLGLYDTASYNKTEAVFIGNTNVSISFFDLVYSFIVSGILTLRLKQNNKI